MVCSAWLYLTIESQRQWSTCHLEPAHSHCAKKDKLCVFEMFVSLTLCRKERGSSSPYLGNIRQQGAQAEGSPGQPHLQ